jgi:plastocyanin
MIGVFLALTIVAPARAAEETVSIHGRAYHPSSLDIRAGDTVVWSNDEHGLLSAPIHTVTADDGSFDSGDIPPGSDYRFRFTSPGVFAYHCNIHSNMHGTIVVAALPTTTKTQTASVRATPTATASAKPAASKTSRPSPSADATASSTPSIEASGVGAGGSSAGVIISVAIVAIVALMLLGWFVYARFLREI